MTSPTVTESPSPHVSSGKALRSTLLVSAATTFSRLLGLVREQLFAALLGAGFFADAFVVAFRIPNLLRDLFAEGALSAAFVPTFAKTEAEEGREGGYRLANRVIGLLLVIVGGLAAIGVLAARPLVGFMAAGYAEVPGKVELTVRLAQVMMPFLPALSLAAVLMGMLNSRGRFGAPALAPALFNLMAIVVGVGLKVAGVSAEYAVLGWSIGTLLGGIAQFGIQLPALWKEGFRLRPSLRGAFQDPAIRRIGRLMTPAVLGLAATQVNIFINTQFASTVQGANAWLNYAFRLMYLPIGIFGVAIATVTTTTMAKSAAQKDLEGLKNGLALGMRHVAFLTIPSTVGLLVLAEPIIGLIYEHGRFHASDTHETAIALLGYAIGLYAYSGVKVVAPAFYSVDRSRIPLIGSALAVVTNLTLNLLLFHWFEHHQLGLALGTSLGALVNLGFLSIAFRRYVRRALPAPGGGEGAFLGPLLRVLGAALLMGGLVYGADFWLAPRLETGGLHHALVYGVRTLVGVLLGLGGYAGACRLLRVAEFTEILAVVARRRARR